MFTLDQNCKPTYDQIITTPIFKRKTYYISSVNFIYNKLQKKQHPRQQNLFTNYI